MVEGRIVGDRCPEAAITGETANRNNITAKQTMKDEPGPDLRDFSMPFMTQGVDKSMSSHHLNKL